jgi:RNA polymerase sigma factor (TIGR02999 family)
LDICHGTQKNFSQLSNRAASLGQSELGRHNRTKAEMDSPLLTEQLRRYSGGDLEVAEAVLREVLPKLHEIAVRELRRERYIAPLCPTELIHEMWIRSLSKGGWSINSREHFYAIAALAMRRVLVDFARNRLAQRRGNGETPDSLDETVSANRMGQSDLEGMVQIGSLMDKLETVNLGAARVVDMHYFAGFTLEEIAEITGLTFRQVRHRWEKGRDWLKDRI